MKQVLYIVDKYPKPTETFIKNEVETINRTNKIRIIILSLSNKKVNNRFTHNYKVEYTKWYGLCTYIRVIKYYISPARNLNNKRSQSRSFTEKLKQFKKIFHVFFIARLIQENKIDHIHAHFASYPTDVAMLTAHILNIKFSFSAHAHDIYTQNHNLLTKKIEKAQFVITCTEHNQNYLDQNCASNDMKKKIHCIYHGIDVNNWRYHPTPFQAGKKHIKILSVARLVEKKGLIYLINAVKILVQKNYQVECTIVGEGPLEKELIDILRKRNLENNITLLKQMPQEQIKKHFYNNNIFVLPSTIATNGDRDGLPNVLLEALATGTPVITTKVSAIPELIESDKTGIFVANNNPEAISSAILRLLNTPYLYQQLVTNGRKRIEQDFNSEKFCNKLINQFESVK